MTPVFDIEWRAAVAVLIRCSAEAWNVLRRWAFVLLLPLLPWLAARGLGALWLGGYPTPPRDRLTEVWELVGGAAATHFPESGAVLPRLVGWLDPVLELTLGVLGVVAVCAVLPEVFRGGTPNAGLAFRRLGTRLGPAWVAAAPGVLGAGALVVSADTVGRLAPFGAVIHAAVWVLAIVFRAFFVYSVAAVVVSGLSPAAAWRRSFLLASRYMAPTITFVGLTFLLTWPWRAAPEVIGDQFGRIPPEWVAGWVASGAVPLVLVTLFVTLATTRLYLHGYGSESPR